MSRKEKIRKNITTTKSPSSLKSISLMSSP